MIEKKWIQMKFWPEDKKEMAFIRYRAWRGGCSLMCCTEQEGCVWTCLSPYMKHTQRQWGAEITSNSCVTQLNWISPSSLTPTRILTASPKPPGVTLYRNQWLADQWWPPLKDSSESSEQLFCCWPWTASVQFGENVFSLPFDWVNIKIKQMQLTNNDRLKQMYCDPVIHW